jgi:mRNA interferase RelE/StbE
MPWYKIAYLPQVVSDLAQIDTVMAQRLLDKTKWLASNAGNLRHDPAAADLPGLLQYAVGDWRIFYSIDPNAHIVDVHLIAHRKTLHHPGRQGFRS